MQAGNRQEMCCQRFRTAQANAAKLKSESECIRNNFKHSPQNFSRHVRKALTGARHIAQRVQRVRIWDSPAGAKTVESASRLSKEVENLLSGIASSDWNWKSHYWRGEKVMPLFQIR